MRHRYKRSKHSVGAQEVADWDPGDSLMKLEPSAVDDSTFQPVRHQATFLGSETAPDGAQVRRSLHEMHKDSRRWTSYATCGAAACTLLAVLLTQRAATHGRVSPPTSRLAPRPKKRMDQVALCYSPDPIRLQSRSAY